MKDNIIKIEILKPFGGMNVGKVIDINTDGNGTPIIEYWRRRIKDSAIDNCLKVLPKKSKKKEVEKK